jgi:hypothetical protein
MPVLSGTPISLEPKGSDLAAAMTIMRTMSNRPNRDTRAEAIYLTAKRSSRLRERAAERLRALRLATQIEPEDRGGKKEAETPGLSPRRRSL